MGEITIAIDGHSSCGKSTLARQLAKGLDYIHIDSGAMYRAVTFYLISDGVDLNHEPSVIDRLSKIDLQLNSHASETLVSLNGQPLDQELRSREVNAWVSEVARISAVREKLVKIQRQQGVQGGVVMDGRDIGSVVFPDAALKIFLTASIEVRTDRRFLELQEAGLLVDMSRQSILENLQHRDHIDSTREDSPLVICDDAVVIDNSNLSREEQLAMIVALTQLRRNK